MSPSSALVPPAAASIGPPSAPPAAPPTAGQAVISPLPARTWKRLSAPVDGQCPLPACSNSLPSPNLISLSSPGPPYEASREWRENAPKLRPSTISNVPPSSTLGPAPTHNGAPGGHIGGTPLWDRVSRYYVPSGRHTGGWERGFWGTMHGFFGRPRRCDVCIPPFHVRVGSDAPRWIRRVHW